MCFRCHGNLSNLDFPLTFNGKSKNRHLLLSHCRYFDKGFTEMFIEKSSTKQIISVQSSEFEWQLKDKFAKKKKKTNSKLISEAKRVLS